MSGFDDFWKKAEQARQEDIKRAKNPLTEREIERVELIREERNLPDDPEQTIYQQILEKYKGNREMYKGAGAPTTYNKEIADIFLFEVISTTDGNKKICKRLGLPYGTFTTWLMKNKEFADLYAQAKEIQVESYAEEIIEIADENIIDPKTSMAEVQRAKNMIEARKFMLENLRPKVYGKKSTVDHNLNMIAPATDDQFNKLLEKVEKTAEKKNEDDAEDIEYQEV
jgi:hypothetical protein